MDSKIPIENISLSFVCDKKWDKMQPCKNGKHCLDCNKTVIDFTNKSMEELQAALSEEGEVCWRFH